MTCGYIAIPLHGFRAPRRFGSTTAAPAMQEWFLSALLKPSRASPSVRQHNTLEGPTWRCPVEELMRAPRFLTRSMLRPLRVLRVNVSVPPDPLSPEYLYLVQQSKRVSLVRSLDRFQRNNLSQWPLILTIVFIKWIDLALSNCLIRSLINEYDLLNRIDAPTAGNRP